MNKYSITNEFEKAALIRDQIKGINQLNQNQKLTDPDSSIYRDIIALKSDDKLAAIQIFQMRSGKLVGRLGYIADSSNLDDNIIAYK